MRRSTIFFLNNLRLFFKEKLPSECTGKDEDSSCAEAERAEETVTKIKKNKGRKSVVKIETAPESPAVRWVFF